MANDRAQNIDRDTIGRGWTFPIKPAPGGHLTLTGGEDKIRQSLWILLSTSLGERVMLPNYGCGIHDLVFASADPTLAGVIAQEVRASLRRWEPRIEISDVLVTFDPDDPRLVHIDVRYVLSRTNDPRNLVVPFYAIPEED